MPDRPIGLRHLDPCLTDRASLTRLRSVLDKVEKCCSALDRNINLADILHDAANFRSLASAFGEDEFDVGMQMLMRIAMSDHETRSFTLTNEIQGRKRIEFIYRSVGGWKQFSATIFLQMPPAAAGGKPGLLMINPARGEHWQDLELVPAGTLVTVYVKTAQGKRSRSQEALAAERYQAVFDTVQNRSDAYESAPTPMVEFGVPNGNGAAARGGAKPAANGAKPAAAKKVSTAPRRTFASAFTSKFAPGAAPSGPPVQTLKVVINKMDTFVHAGNAHLILNHLQGYGGRVQFFVLRASKQPVALDADSMWGAEIRNGETVIYEFYGPQPGEEFLKELAKKTNKYTQMDKIANE